MKKGDDTDMSLSVDLGRETMDDRRQTSMWRHRRHQTTSTSVDRTRDLVFRPVPSGGVRAQDADDRPSDGRAPVVSLGGG